jgi:hypothetical protein
MAFKLQVADVRQDPGIIDVSGVCHDSTKFRDQVDTVIRQLLKRGGWFGTQVLTKFCIHNCSITLPRHVGTLLATRFCNAGFAPIHNNWYAIVGPSSGVWNMVDYAGGLSLRDDGLAPTYRDVIGNDGKQIAYHVVKRADVGKQITIYGFQAGGQPLQTKQADGTWKMGVTITAQPAGGVSLPAMTTQLVTKITSVVREQSEGMAYLYQYDATNGLIDMAEYQPTETNPQYRRTKILNSCGLGHVDDYDRRVMQMEAMVKLEYIKLVNEWDFLIIDDLDAIRYGIQALKAETAGDADQAEIFWAKAIRELNFTDRDKTPYNQISVRVRTGAGYVSNPI